jgi:hypothetical protein
LVSSATADRDGGNRKSVDDDGQGIPAGSSTRWRFWDGAAWTDHVHPEPQRALTAQFGRGNLVIAIGGVALAGSPFLTWVNVVLLGGLNLFELLRISGRPTGLAWIAVGVGALVVCLSLLSDDQGSVRVVAVVAGAVVGFPALLLVAGMVDEVRQTHSLVRVTIGPWVGLLGCLGMLVGGLMPQKQRL